MNKHIRMSVWDQARSSSELGLNWHTCTCAQIVIDVIPSQSRLHIASITCSLSFFPRFGCNLLGKCVGKIKIVLKKSIEKFYKFG